MSTFRNPVGPQPSRVYWRRRLFVALGILVIIVIAVLVVVRPGSGGAASTPGTSSAPPEAVSTNPADASACDPTKVTVTAETDAASYEAGVNPTLSFTLKSTALDACTFAAGSDVQEYVITSGSERIWSSKDCQTAPVAALTLLLPGVPKAGPSLPWDRTRSSVDTCAAPKTPVIAGGASYHLDVIVNKVSSGSSRQFLLNG